MIIGSTLGQQVILDAMQMAHKVLSEAHSSLVSGCLIIKTITICLYHHPKLLRTWP